MRAVAAAGLLAAASALAACSSDATAVTPPTPTGAAASACRDLDTHLPAKVDGASSSPTSPDSPYVAAWGDIVLTCGGPAPVVPVGAQLFAVQGVDWYAEPLPQGGTRFTTVGRIANVSVAVPATRRPEANVLVDIAPTVARYVQRD